MCRWFAYISPTEPCLLEDVLVTPGNSLSKQVNAHFLPGLLPHDHTIDQEHDLKVRNSVFNIDGMGLAWYTSSNSDFEGPNGESCDGTKKEGLRPATYKTVQPPINDMNFRSLCANVETRVLFAHIRAASGTMITPVNNHPFVFGRHTFMHNGVVSDFTAIKRDMCNLMSDSAFANIHGATDSEHMAALYMTYLTGAESASSFEKEFSATEMAEAFQKVITTVIELQRTIIGDNKRTPNSLNLCATDGIKIVACRFRNASGTRQPPSLYYSTKAGTTLNRKYPDDPDGASAQKAADPNSHPVHVTSTDISPLAKRKPEKDHGRHLIIASEPSTYKEEDWHLIGKNQYLVAESDGTFEVRDLQCEADWDCDDHTAHTWFTQSHAWGNSSEASLHASYASLPRTPGERSELGYFRKVGSELTMGGRPK